MRRQGEPLARWALTRLEGYTYDFPPSAPNCGWPRAGVAAGVGAGLGTEALEHARRLKPTRSALRAEVAAATWLARQAPADGLAELRTSCGRLLRRRWGGGREAALRLAVVALADLDSGDGARAAEAIELEQALRSGEGRWLAAIGVATAPEASAAVAAQQLDFAVRAMRWRAFLYPPLTVLGPLVTQLGQALPGGLRHPLGQRLGRLTVAAAEGRCSGPELAAEWMTVGATATEPGALAALAALASRSDFGWWRLPLLAMLADSLAARLDREARWRSGGAVPDEDPGPEASAIRP